MGNISEKLTKDYPMGMGHLNIKMEMNMMGNLKMDYLREKENIQLKMGMNTLANSKKEKEKEVEYILFPMEIFIKVSLKKICFMVKDYCFI